MKWGNTVSPNSSCLSLVCAVQLQYREWDYNIMDGRKTPRCRCWAVNLASLYLPKITRPVHAVFWFNASTNQVDKVTRCLALKFKRPRSNVNDTVFVLFKLAMQDDQEHYTHLNSLLNSTTLKKSIQKLYQYVSLLILLVVTDSIS
jgi:hypothetical protein